MGASTHLEILTFSFKKDHTQQGCDYTLASSLFENKEIFTVLSERGKESGQNLISTDALQLGSPAKRTLSTPVFAHGGHSYSKRSPETYPQVSGHASEGQAP